MAINFEKIKYKNFLSTGNSFNEVEINKTPTTLIVGKNGQGKCLEKNTVVEISFDDDEIEKKFKKMFE